MSASIFAIGALGFGLAACGLFGGGETQGFVCSCHESEQETGGPPINVCSTSQTGAIEAARKCAGTPSNVSCTCTPDPKGCRSGGCR